MGDAEIKGFGEIVLMKVIKKLIGFTVFAVFLILGLMFIFRPVCVLLSDEDLKHFNIPIEERTDKDFYLKVFQQKNGQWHQCKTWVSRTFFF
jgi:hypothetical protein